MELGHLLTRSGLTYPEVSSKVCHDSFCQLDSSVSLPWVICFEAFYLHVVSSFSFIPVIISNNAFRPQKTLKKTRIKLYNTLAIPFLLYGSETWTIKATDARRIRAAEMKYMRKTAGYTWTDYKTNAQIAK